MKIHSSLASSFARKAFIFSKNILQNEMGLSVRKNRFLFEKSLCPIYITITTHKNQYGSFNPKYFQISLSIILAHEKDSLIKDVLRHELAHYLTWLKYGNVMPHGEEFKNVCMEFFKKSIAEPTLNLEKDHEQRIGEIEQEKILLKIKKLLALAESNQAEEAKLAMLKAHQLLLRHHLSMESIREKEDFILYSKVVKTQSRKDGKLVCLYEILSHFMLHPIFVIGRGEIKLEVTGTLAEVKLAEYVSAYLDHELDRLWLESGLKGSASKKAFFEGIALGYKEKVEQQLKDFNPLEKKALQKFDQSKTDFLKNIYGRLSHKRTQKSSDENSLSIGRQAGFNLSIKKPIDKQNSKTFLIGE